MTRQWRPVAQQHVAVLISFSLMLVTWPFNAPMQRALPNSSLDTSQALTTALLQFGHSFQPHISAGIDVEAASFFNALPTEFGFKVEALELTNLTGETINPRILLESFNTFAVASSIMQAFGSIFYKALGKEAKEMADGNAVYMADASLKKYTALKPDVAVIVLGDEGARDNSYSLTIGSVYYKGTLYLFSHMGVIHWQALRDFLGVLPESVRVLGVVGDALEKTNGLADADAAFIPTDSTSLFTLFTNQKIKDIVPLMNDGWRLAGISYFGPEAGVHALDLPSVALLKIARAAAPEKMDDYINNITVMVLGPRSSSLTKGNGTDRRHEHIIEDVQDMQKRYPGLRIWMPGDGDCMPRMVASAGISLDGRRLVVFGRSGFAEATSAAVAASTIAGGHFINRFVSTERTNGARSVTQELAANYTPAEIASYDEFSISPAVYGQERDGTWIPGPGIIAMTSVTGASAHEQSVDALNRIKEDRSKPHFGQTFANLIAHIRIFETGLWSGRLITNTLLITERGERYRVRTTFSAAHLKNVIGRIREAHPDSKLFWAA